MSTYSSPSDYTAIDVNYTAGKGYYTTASEVSSLLQIADFDSNSTPTLAEVGKIIKRVEGKIDDTTKTSFRPVIYSDEYHNFEFSRLPYQPMAYYIDYVGFVQLDHSNVRKILRLEVWQGNNYVDLASATATVSLSSSLSSLTSITLTVGPHSFVIRSAESGGVSTRFNRSYGPKTTAQELIACINEIFPYKTAEFTGGTEAKVIAEEGGDSFSVSDFFYATTDSEDSTKVVISSKLPGDDGTNCGITVQGSGATVTAFTDNQTMKRLGDYWTISHEGKIFFLKNYPYIKNHSVRVTYVAGSKRVNSAIHDAATKLVAAEIIRHDDNSILIADTQSGISLKEKHDILIEEANKIIDGKKNIVFLIE